MALTSTISYCENQDIFDIYPRIDSFDLKRRLSENWVRVGTKHTLHNTGKINRLFKNGEDLGLPEDSLAQVNTNDEWIYNIAGDKVIMHQDLGFAGGGTDPNTLLIEAGENWDTAITRFRRKASRLIEAKLGKSISREILKDREGNYPTSIIQATALKSAILFISAHNPLEDDLIPLKAEYDDIIGKIQSGRIVMTGHRSADDSKGFLRPVREGNFPKEDDNLQQTVYPVELKGNYTGSNYELLYLYFMGLSSPALENSLKYWVYGKSNTKLVDKQLVEETLINYDYQYLGVGNLYVRFSVPNIGSVNGAILTTESDPYTTPMIYEIELWGSNIQPTVSQIKSIELTKKDTIWPLPRQ